MSSEMREFGALDVENLRSLREVVAGTEHWAKVVSLDRAIALLARTEAGADVEWNAHSERLYELNAAPVADGAVAWSVVRVGNQGAAYDPPNTHRAFTYEKQPGNVDASRLGRATDAAAAASAGDSIDRGLALLKELQAVGFGVFHIGPVAMQAKEAPNRSAMMRDDEMRGSECEKACDYWLRFKEQDGGMSPWYRCSLEQYARARRQHDSDTCVTKKGETP